MRTIDWNLTVRFLLALTAAILCARWAFHAAGWPAAAVTLIAILPVTFLILAKLSTFVARNSDL